MFLRVVALVTNGLASILLPHPSEAAPCCAGSSQNSALITGDERTKLQVSAGYASVVADAPTDGLPVFRNDSSEETTQTYRLSGAQAFGERFQAGLALSLQNHRIRRSSSESSATGLGDVSLSGGYEILPEWEYSGWKPRGFAYLALSVPTGKSIHESDARYGSDVTGRGFVAVSPGLAFVKRWNDWDATLMPELTFSAPRAFANVGRVSPGPEARIYAGGGWSSGILRTGLFVSPEYRATQTTENGGVKQKSAPSLRFDTGVELSAITPDDWAFTGTYTDQTLFGPARNTTLSRSFALSVTKRLPR